MLHPNGFGYLRTSKVINLPQHLALEGLLTTRNPKSFSVRAFDPRSTAASDDTHAELRQW